MIETSDNLPDGCLAKSDTLASAVEGGDAVAGTKSTDGDSTRVYVTSATDSDGNTVLLQIGRSIEPELDTLSQLRTILLAVVGISIVPAMLGGYALSGRALRPIKTAMDSQRAFIADASHELRTPVAVVRTNAELLERHIQSGTIGRSNNDATAVEDILSESERLGRMVGQMLTLAQADTGQAIRAKSVLDLGQVAEGVARSSGRSPRLRASAFSHRSHRTRGSTATQTGFVKSWSRSWTTPSSTRTRWRGPL